MASQFFQDLVPVNRVQSILVTERAIQSRLLSAQLQIQERIRNTARGVTEKGIDAVQGGDKTNAPAPVQVVLPPVQVSGFYKATSNTVITFYVNTALPMLPDAVTPVPVGSGWSAQGITGIAGSVVVTAMTISTENSAVKISEGVSESYLWSFTCQTDTEQNIQGVHGVIGATLYPPSATSLVTNSVIGTLQGFFYVTQGRSVFYIQGTTPPDGFGPDWTVSGIPNLKSTSLVTVSFVPVGGTVTELWPYDSYVTLKGDQIEDNTSDPVTCTISIKQPLGQAKIIGANVTQTSDYTGTVNIQMNSNIKLTGGAPLRELGENTRETSFQDKYQDIEKSGYNTGTSYALYAIGPQEKYTTGKEDLIFNTDWKQHSNFVCFQQNFPIQGTAFLGQTITVEFKPKEMSDLMSNMYFTCTLPALTSTSNIYTNQVGRSLIAQCDFMIDDTIVETVYDDWFFIRDQVFLDADEQLAMFSAVNAGSATSLSPTSPVNVCVPLEFFFCRRHSALNKGRERLRRPYFPLCSLYNQRFYIRIQFQPWVWISNDNGVVNKEIINPALIIEQIKLTEKEKIHYRSQDLSYVVNRVKKESVLSFNSFTTQLQLTASFPVQMLVWFFRNKKYETVTSTLYNDSRYEYGFTTKYIQTAISVPFVSQTSYFIDPISSIKIVLNNTDITSTFQGSLYYSYKQPMEHNLSIPAKNIYMYSFGLNPKEYNAGGYINFSKLDSQTTNVTLFMNQQYATQVSQGYNLYLFYYGYSILEFKGGYARLPFL